MRFKVLALVLVVSMMLVSSVGLAEESPAQMASDGMKWDVGFAYDKAYLTLAGPDALRIERTFPSDEALYLSIYDEGGAVLPDGSYNYEWTFSPQLSGEVEALMRDGGEELRGQLAGDLRALGALPEEMPAVSGHFAISGGALVADLAEEFDASETSERMPSEGSSSGADLLDQVVLDNQIVIGSLCVGQDCVNNESFGFDTIRLKENNLRIKFQDTSNTASFPSNDWQLTANDSANGGLNKFSIDDVSSSRTPFTIEAGAPSHSLYVEDYGRVGFGTSTPVVELHVKDSDTPTLRLEQDSSGGWTPQTWDLAGNETNFFIRDATNGSTLPFRIQPGAPSSALTIKADGKVGIGTWSPEAALEIETSTFSAMYLDRVGGAQARFVTGPNIAQLGTTSANRLEVIVNSQTVAKFDTDQSTTLYGDLTVQGTIYRSDGTVVGGLAGEQAGNGSLEARVAAQDELIADLLARIEALEAALSAPVRAE